MDACRHVNGEAMGRGKNLHGLKDFRTENGSSQGQNLALTGSFVPGSLDSGPLHSEATDVFGHPLIYHAAPYKLLLLLDLI